MSDLERNDKSRNAAVHHLEPWSHEEIEFLLEFWPTTESHPDCTQRVAAEFECAEALGRTIEACRQRRYEVLWGKKHGVTAKVMSTTTTTVEYRGLMDDPDECWWSADYYTNPK